MGIQVTDTWMLDILGFDNPMDFMIHIVDISAI